MQDFIGNPGRFKVGDGHRPDRTFNDLQAAVAWAYASHENAPVSSVVGIRDGDKLIGCVTGDKGAGALHKLSTWPPDAAAAPPEGPSNHVVNEAHAEGYRAFIRGDKGPPVYSDPARAEAAQAGFDFAARVTKSNAGVGPRRLGE